MEQKFKVGDRVRHEQYGDGVVCDVVGKRCLTCFTEGPDVRKVGWVKRRELINLTPTTDTSRAMIAAMCLQGLLSNPHEDVRAMSFQKIVDAAVEYAEAIEDALQNPKP